MVHALKEAHRVLKPNGLLIDLRPAPAHRRVGLGEGRRWHEVGALHEVLDDDYAADAAIAEMVRQRYLHTEQRIRFQLDRVMDAMDEIRDWLSDFDTRRQLPSHAWLLDRLEQQRARSRKPEKITVRGPMKLVVLTKLQPAQDESYSGGTMILAILPDASKAESLLNNLSEADFNIHDVSVIMQDVATRDKIHKDAGPLKGVKPAQLSGGLTKAGVSPDATQRSVDAVKSDKVLVAMQVDAKYEQAARQMFSDMSAEML
jgi:SAM-dependent methyltransferase